MLTSLRAGIVPLLRDYATSPIRIREEESLQNILQPFH